MLVTFPTVLAIDEVVTGNPIRQIGERRVQVEGVLATFTRGRLQGLLFEPMTQGHPVLVLPAARRIPDGHARVLEAVIDQTAAVTDASDGRWVRHPLIDGRAPNIDYAQEIQAVLKSWEGAFSYEPEDVQRQKVGLRRPQIGAVHAAHAHWSVSKAPATIVMPTGTGKTDTMLSILVSVGCPKLLVVVPTDALRAQLADKFLTLGILVTAGSTVLRSDAKHPIVGTLQHIPRTTEQVDAVFTRSQVVVTTSSIAGQCSAAVQERMAYHCPYLFIDEAHHVEAPTWSNFKERFAGQRILQFTATPFREDGKLLDGPIIYKYPLKQAQADGYFTTIKFQRVVAFNPAKADEAIAQKAVAQLRADAGKGHIVMARVDSVARAAKVFELYGAYPEFRPVQLHTGIKSRRERETIRGQIVRGESRIVVCVDMLGEGFDLPELKIAAFHDIRKTLAVTLQLAGRFTRARRDLGEATFIANVADINVQDELRKLYTRDPDWNALLPELGERLIGEQQSLQEFLAGFTEFSKEIPLKTVRPATSAVVYRTTCDRWTPENFRAGVPGLSSCEQVHESINHAEHILIVVTARRVPLAWADLEIVFDWQWELYVVVWSPEQNLLFINSSTNSGEYRALAAAVGGPGATLIQGQAVFRSFEGVSRLRLQSVGLTEQLGRNVRYTSRMGADVGPALPERQLRHARKSVLSGSGYEQGGRATVGASRKGRVWSHRRDRVDQLVAWCKAMGAKLIDERIDADEVLKGTLEAQTLDERPPRMPIAVDWPEEIYRAPEVLWSMTLGEAEYTMGELEISVVSPGIEGPLRFAVSADNKRAEFELEFFRNGDVSEYRFVAHDQEVVRIRRGGSTAEDASEFFYFNPPVFWFGDGSALEGNQYIELKGAYPPYDSRRIREWDWAGVNIRKESQGRAKDADSVQAKVIRELKSSDYHMIVDDDGKGEAADVVAIRLVGDVAAPSEIDVEFYHCKFSRGALPGRRIEDLYELCGQAQKSIWWMYSPEKRTELFTHLLRRVARDREAGMSRYEVGDDELLQTIREMSHLCPVSLRIYIVQPGLSKANVTRDQLELLSVTENHLLETFQIPFGVIASR